MRTLRRVTVFTGSRPGARPEYAAAAREFGDLLAARGVGLVYGGASVGLMGTIADAALARGGEVIGVIPRLLVEKELAHRALTELHQVESMHERKAKMAALSDAFVALPGGFGTLDELFEIATWAQLGIHEKPIGLLSTAGYYEPLRAAVDHAVKEGFALPEHAALFVIEEDPARLFDRLLAYERPTLGGKWTPPAAE